ncbi:HAD family hydrolase [Alphaproteobacteria bacterium]|nr:HAD family hydrolase [Alphaproteobacteria bacterium]
MKKAVFLDRDGVITVPLFRNGRSYAATTLKDFKIYPESEEALHLLKKAGFLLVVVTNQPDINRGIITGSTMRSMNRALSETLPIDSIKVCPHTREENCLCRKPSPGLLVEACTEFSIDTFQSYMIGDRSSDMEAGRSLNCKSIFIDLGYTAEKKPSQTDFQCKGILEATKWILSQK